METKEFNYPRLLYDKKWSKAGKLYYSLVVLYEGILYYVDSGEDFSNANFIEQNKKFIADVETVEKGTGEYKLIKNARTIPSSSKKTQDDNNESTDVEAEE